MIIEQEEIYYLLLQRMERAKSTWLEAMMEWWDSPTVDNN